MNNILRQIDAGDIVFFKENQYSNAHRQQYLDMFESLKKDGIINARYKDMVWDCYTGIHHGGINFELDKRRYNSHIGKRFGITYATMQDMLKCYAIYLFGIFIIPTIQMKISAVREFLTSFGDAGFILPETSMETIDDFLFFIGTPEDMINDLLKQVRVQQAPKRRQRTLAHLINYIAIANEIDDLYKGEISDEDFVQWFPIFFWTKITFIIPLRATEMLVTPFNCIEERGDKLYIHLRRTLLKKGLRTVYYDVEKDYKEFAYHVPDNWTIQCIRKYQNLTAGRKRKYLFDYYKYAINKMLGLEAFNALLAKFITTYLIGNRKYDFARYATGIEDFEVVTAGDSRPIAMSNLYFQDVGPEICRELANHTHITTSYGYYTNVSNTVYCSSIMHMQRNINRGYHDLDNLEMAYALDKTRQALRQKTGISCISERKPLITGDIEDCVREGHLQECLGCKYYYPTEEELKQQLAERKKRLDEVSKEVVDYLSDATKFDEMGADFEKIMLDAQTSIYRYREVSDEKAKEAVRKWQRHKHTPKTN